MSKKLTKKQQQVLEAREKQIKYWETRTDHDGAAGIIKELESAPITSAKIDLASQGENDCYIKWTSSNGYKVVRPVEIKTNGGRIGGILHKENKDRLIIYSMDICNSSTKYKNRVVPQVILTYGEFVQLLVNANAIKDVNRNGKFEDFAVQSSSLQLFLRLNKIIESVPSRLYYPNKRYSSDDLEDISNIILEPYKRVRRC